MERVMKRIVLSYWTPVGGRTPSGKVTGDEALSQKARSRLDDLSL